MASGNLEVMTDTFRHKCLQISVTAARAAGDAALAAYHGDFQVEYKEDHTPVTLADRRAHQIIVERLQRLPEQVPILSEEGKHIPYSERRRWEWFWLVDPLDGTKEFIKQRGEFTVNIALIHHRRPILGVVLVPVRGLLYFAVEGLGSYRLESEQISQLPSHPEVSTGLSEKIISRARKLPLEDPRGLPHTVPRITGSRSHASKRLADFLREMEKAYGGVEFIAAGSALKFGLIAEGSADLYPRFSPTMEWDTAAGQCLVEQSGGAVLLLKEPVTLHYNKTELSNPHFLCRSARYRNFSYPCEGIFPGEG